jgi:hypothetical protein
MPLLPPLLSLPVTVEQAFKFLWHLDHGPCGLGFGVTRVTVQYRTQRLNKKQKRRCSPAKTQLWSLSGCHVDVAV